MSGEVFTLSANAFHVLGARYASTAAEIAELTEEAEFRESASDTELQKAQQALLTPRLRVSAELTWLPELGEGQLAKVFSEIAKPSERSILRLVVNLPELAAANILAHLCSAEAVGFEVISALIGAWSAIDTDAVLDFLRSTRKAAGFPEADSNLVKATLAEVRLRHACVAVLSIAKNGDGLSVIQRLVNNEVTDGHPSPLLTDVVKEYERSKEADFSRLADEISRVIELAKADEINVGTATSKISGVLSEWCRLTDPVAGFYVWKGHSAPRSKGLFYQVRTWSLHIANEKGKLEESRAMSMALEKNFSRTEELRRVAQKDVDDLDNWISEQRIFENFAPLHEAAEGAKASYPNFAKLVKKHGLKSNSPAVVGDLVNRYENFVTIGGDINIAANLGRDLALFVNNDKKDPELAYHVLYFVQQRMTSQTTPEVRAAISADADTAFRNWKFGVLQKHSGDVARLISLVDEILKIAPVSLMAEYQTLRADLEAKRKQKRKRMIRALIGAGVVAGIIAIANLADKPSSSPAYSATRSSQSSTNPTYSPGAASTNVSTSPQQDLSEVRPQIGNDSVLGLSQVRYCVFQRQRLELLRNMTTTDETIEKFNSLIDDFNSRCSNYRYRKLDMDTVNREASNRNLLFRSEATKIAQGW